MARRLPPLPTVSDLIRLYRLSAKSQLSQNFLLDLNVTDRMVRLAGGVEGSCVCEVGPGPGSLTRSILNAGAKKLVVIEKDRRFIPSLLLLQDASDDRLEIHYGDALEFDMEKPCAPNVETKGWNEVPPNFHVLGNLPFNVSLPLLIQWLSMVDKRSGPFKFGRSQLTLTFQKEVAERITAPPGDSQRSRLSVMAQYCCDIKPGFKIRGSTFVPPPKVDAMVLKLTPLVKPQITVDFVTLERIVKALFQYRRKFIRKGAELLFPGPRHRVLSEELFRLSGVDDTLRAQQLSMIEFEQLCHAYQTLVSEELGYEHSNISVKERA